MRRPSVTGPRCGDPSVRMLVRWRTVASGATVWVATVYTPRSVVCYPFLVEAFAFAFLDVANSTPVVSAQNAPLPSPVDRRPTIRVDLRVNRRRDMELEFPILLLPYWYTVYFSKTTNDSDNKSHTAYTWWNVDGHKRRNETFEMWYYRKIQRISWINPGLLIKKLPKERVLEKRSAIRKRWNIVFSGIKGLLILKEIAEDSNGGS